MYRQYYTTTELLTAKDTVNHYVLTYLWRSITLNCSNLTVEFS